MSTRRVVYAGSWISGRTTSVTSLLGRLKVKADSTLNDPYGEHTVPLGPDEHLVSIYRYLNRSFETPVVAWEHPRGRLEIERLCAADGIVFVLDSQRPRGEANLAYFQSLGRDLAQRGVNLNDKPVVFQANKRDLPDLIPVAELREAFRTPRCAFVESIARQGVGTVEAMQTLAAMMREG